MMAYFPPKIKQYQRYRRIGTELHHKIIRKYVNGDVIEEAARALRLGKNRKLELEREDELSVLMEYAIYEIRGEDGRNFIEKYRAEVGGKNRIERELLAAKEKAEPRLFRVENTWSERYCIDLCDLMKPGDKVELTDINFSQSMRTDLIVFLRPIKLSEFTVTSGVSFVYPKELEDELKEQWRKWEKDSSAERYAKAFQLYKNKGCLTIYV